jgi:type IV secretion system protein VirB10
MASSPWPVVVGLLGALGLGALIFVQLSANRARIEAARLTDPAPGSAPLSADDVPPPPDLSSFAQSSPVPPAPESEAMAASPIVEPPPPPPPPGPTQIELERLRAPALVIDLGEFRSEAAKEQPPVATGTNPGAIVAAVGGAQPPVTGLGAGAEADERFARRLGVGDTSKPAKAVSMVNLATTVVEGSIIPAVLETALNSDLPGYVRAVVSRDVRGFDGSSILIPRGSRLIGQYRSGMALGQSRAFVIWTRLIRPDGASVSLASPATDALGRGGLDGEVDRHFLQRFGGAMLLTLLNLGVSAATEASDTSIVIASTRAGADSVGVALSKDLDISPTVTVPQGSPVRVFVSQDLDFTSVGPAAPSETDR